MSIRKAGRGALGALIFGFLAFGPAAKADTPATTPVTSYAFANVPTQELQRKFEAATAEFLEEKQKEAELKAKFQRTLALRGTSAQDGDILGHAVDTTYVAQLLELTAQFNKVTAMEEALSLIAEIIDSRLLPLIFLSVDPEDKAAIGRREDALNWAKQRHGSEMILLPAPPKPENRAKSVAPSLPAAADNATTSI